MTDLLRHTGSMKLPKITLSLCGLMMFLFVSDLSGALIWHSHLGPQSWTLLSTHFIHSDIEHLVPNLIVFCLLGGIIESNSKRDLIYTLVGGVLAVNLYLIGLFPLLFYVGLPGVLNTLLVVAMFNLSQSQSFRSVAIGVLVLSMFKIIYEIYTGNSAFSTLNWHCVPQAQLAGWLMGVAIVSVKTVHYFSRNKYKLYREVISV